MQLQWEKRFSEEKGLEIASVREEIFREFEEQKKAEILETLEEAKEAWIEESEEQKREEVNEAMAYLESEYTKSLEEFKQKTLNEALEQARKQWTTEELLHRENIVKVSLTIWELFVNQRGASLTLQSCKCVGGFYFLGISKNAAYIWSMLPFLGCVIAGWKGSHKREEERLLHFGARQEQYLAIYHLTGGRCDQYMKLTY